MSSIEHIILKPTFILFLCCMAFIFLFVLSYKTTQYVKQTLQTTQNKPAWIYLYFSLNGIITWYLITYQNIFNDPYGIIKQIGSPVILLTTGILLVIFLASLLIKADRITQYDEIN